MDFGEGRLPYAGVNVNYLKDRMKKDVKKTPEYIIQNFENEEFLDQCFWRFVGKIPTKEDARRKKIHNWLSRGVDKEVVVARFLELKTSESDCIMNSNTEDYFRIKMKNYKWDFSFLLTYDNEALVFGCYREILEREPDEAGYVGFCEQLYDGAPKEAILFMIGSSPEAVAKKRIKNLDEYRKIYEKYKECLETGEGSKKKKLKQIAHMPGSVEYLQRSLYHSHLKDDFRYEALLREMHILCQQNYVMLDAIVALKQEIERLKENDKK